MANDRSSRTEVHAHPPGATPLACSLGPAEWRVYALVCVVLAACGGDVSTVTGGEGGAGGAASASSTVAATGGAPATSTSTSATVATSSSSGSGAGPGWDCVENADCPEGACVEVAPGGVRLCTREVPDAIGCDPMHEGDQCCTSGDCAMAGPAARCIDNEYFPACGGAPPQPQNICAADLCQNDAECFSGFCAPAGTFGYPGRTCVAAYCRSDADCNAQPGGFCAPIESPCCPLRDGLGCVYPGGCRRSSDCPEGQCVLDFVEGVGRCEPNGVPCPAVR